MGQVEQCLQTEKLVRSNRLRNPCNSPSLPLLLNSSWFPRHLGTQEFRNHSLGPSPSCFPPGGTQAGVPILGCLLPPMSLVPNGRKGGR